MDLQEYELAFVTTLPKGVRVVEPHTLDFSKNPAGALAFRYRHGWVLVNPLIPSRGSSGGGLARQHGHISGGFTTGHFHKGADGKIHFKAVNRYADKADWEKEIKNAAGSLGAKQEAVKAAVAKAETASNAAQKLEGSGAPTSAKAVAHKLASDAHLQAAQAFQKAGEGPAHKAGALTHNAHSAIHSAKATKLEQAAKAEIEQAKVEALKTQASQMSDKANKLTADTKGSLGLPKEKAALHQEAAEAHKAAQAANEKAGNKYVAEAHGKAGEKHETIAQKQLNAQKQLDAAAEIQSMKASQASKAAEEAAKEPLGVQVSAHQAAAAAHGDAGALHSNLGNKGAAQDHLTQKMAHTAAAKNLSQQKAEQDALEAAHKTAHQEALKLALAAGGHGDTAEGAKAHVEASKAFLKAHKAARAAGLKEEASKHLDRASSHATKAAVINSQVKAAEEAKKAQQAKLENESQDATAKAQQLSKEADKGESISAHKAAKTAHMNAAEAAKQAGYPGAAAYHNGMATKHDNAADALHAKVVENQKQQAKLNQAAYNASDDAKELSAEANKSNTPEAHAAAQVAHTKAIAAAQKAGHGPEVEEFHKNQMLAHAAKAKQLKEQQAGTTKEAQDKAKNESVQAVQVSEQAASAGTAEAHLKAADAHTQVAALAKNAGLHNLAKYHTFEAGEHQKKAASLKSAGDAATAAKAAAVPAPPVQTTAAGEKPLKPVGKLTGTGKTLGTHGSEVMTDEAGNKWLKKSDSQGYARTLDPAVAALHRKAGLETPVFVKTKTGHLQGMLPGSKEAFPNGSFNPEHLSEEDITSMLKHQVMDFATGNQDTHSGQWLRTADGKLIQIDQGQAFKFGVGNDPTKTHPPLGSDVPVYPKLWNAAKAGKIQIPDPNGDNDFAKAIKAVQDMPDDQFKALFKPYAEQVLKNGGHPGGHSTVDGFLNDIVQHKNSIGKDFEKLYNPLPDSAKAGAPGTKPSKEEALAKVADFAANPPENWTVKTFQELKQAAKEAGASPDELKAAQYTPEKYLKKPEAPAVAATSTTAPSKPAVDPFKPKAKWSKVTHGIKVGGEIQHSQGLQGPKGLVVHKGTGGKGWTVSSADGLSMGGNGKFKTQKEAKLAAEWMAKNYGSNHVTKENFNTWKDSHPEAFQTFKQGVLNEQWNKDAQAALDQAQTATPSPVAAVSSLPAPKPMVMFTGLGDNKKDNAALMKQLYDQAHGPNATPAMKAEYAKAQEAWTAKHSTGPFDPSKFVAAGQMPPLGSKSNPVAVGAKKQIKKTGNPGFVPKNPTYGMPSNLTTDDPEVVADNTKKTFPSSYERGYRMVPLTVSANGDWKPEDADKGPGTGAYIYSTNAYSSINLQLRGNPKQGIAPVGPTGGQWDNVIAHTDAIFDKVPPTTQKIVLSRRMQESGVFPVPPPPLAPGATYTEPGYSSTAKYTGTWSGSVQMEIRVPPGAKLLDLNHTTGSDHPTESEVLLPRNTKYRVVSDSWSEPGASKSGKRLLVVEVVV